MFLDHFFGEQILFHQFDPTNTPKCYTWLESYGSPLSDGKYEFFFSTCEASDFRWRSQTDFLHDQEARLKEKEAVDGKMKKKKVGTCWVPTSQCDIKKLISNLFICWYYAMNAYWKASIFLFIKMYYNHREFPPMKVFLAHLSWFLSSRQYTLSWRRRLMVDPTDGEDEDCDISLFLSWFGQLRQVLSEYCFVEISLILMTFHANSSSLTFNTNKGYENECKG